VDPADKVALVTGAASGIGRGTALALARAGADLVLADVNERRLVEARKEIAALGRRVLAIRCDVSSDEDVEQLAEQAFAAMGRVDILMNNAGVVLRGALEQISIADWRWAFEINVLGVTRGLHAFLPHMLARGSGHIVNTASIAGLVALTGEGAPYIASKFAVVGLTEALALYARPRGIGVSLLCPARVQSNLHETGRSVGMTPDRELTETAQAALFQDCDEVEPDVIGELVVDAVRHDRFFVLAEPSHQPLLERRVLDMNAFFEQRLAESGQVRKG
jgi:NAD(P)-dependent dehydrogenase (short-subunit alcohol dehydrogenase family)